MAAVKINETGECYSSVNPELDLGKTSVIFVNDNNNKNGR